MLGLILLIFLVAASFSFLTGLDISAYRIFGFRYVPPGRPFRNLFVYFDGDTLFKVPRKAHTLDALVVEAQEVPWSSHVTMIFWILKEALFVVID